MQPSIFAYIHYGDNLLFQLHFILFAEEANLKADKFERWSKNVENIIIDLAEKEKINIEHFKNIIDAATHKPVFGITTFGFTRRQRVGDIHDTQRALLSLCAPEHTQKRVDMYTQYIAFLAKKLLGGRFSETIHHSLEMRETRKQEKLMKKLKP